LGAGGPQFKSGRPDYLTATRGGSLAEPSRCL